MKLEELEAMDEWQRDCFYEDCDVELIRMIVRCTVKRVRIVLRKNKGDLVQTVMDLQDGIIYQFF